MTSVKEYSAARLRRMHPDQWRNVNGGGDGERGIDDKQISRNLKSLDYWIRTFAPNKSIVWYCWVLFGILKMCSAYIDRQSQGVYGAGVCDV